MSTTVSSWIETRRTSNEKFTKDPITKQENNLVLTVLESLLQNQASGSATASRINEIYSPRLTSGRGPGVGWLWGALADGTRWFGASHTQQLVGLVVTLKQLPDVVDRVGHVVKYSGKVIWREMPDWGWIFAEHGIGLDYDTEGCSYEQWHAQAPGLLNANIFAATLTSRTDIFTPNMHYANIAFREILQPFDDSRGMAEEWKMYIPPAAVWISICGKVLYECCVRESGAAASEVGHIEKSDLERWKQVQQRFEALRKQVDIDEHCRGLASQAAEEMKRIEQSF
ncbi:hypothetical protein E4T49_06103 [Aureobasidium sp. EXF-10728]|nr:hypothetical protein E4T49_06103 [Aureobasidium sp. EXF-10728]